MSALTRLQAYLTAMRKLPVWTYPQFAQQVPIDLLGVFAGTTAGNSVAVPATPWSAFTIYTVGQKASSGLVVYASLANGNVNHAPPNALWWAVSAADRYPASPGNSNGEMYLTSDVSPPQTFIWYVNTWYPLSGSSTGGGGGGGIVSVTASAPVVSSGGAAPDISMAAATAIANGYMTSTYAAKLDGIAAGANLYVLPIASAGSLGGIRVGSNLSIDGSGILSSTSSGITAPYTLAGVGDTVPFTINAIAGQTARLQSWQVNTVDKVWFTKDGAAYFAAGQAIFDLSGNLTVYQGLSATNSPLYMHGAVADSAGAVGTILNNNIALVTTGAKLLSVRNNTVEKFYVDKDGNAYAGGILLVGATSTTVGVIGAHEKAGFVNSTTSTLSFDNGTRDFTLTPVGTCVVWAGNVKYSYTTPQVVNVPNTIGVHFIYINSAGTLVQSTLPWGGIDSVSSSFAMVAFVYWDGTKGACVDERHGAERNRLTHQYLHNTRGATYYNGLTGTFTDTTLSVDAGAIYDEDLYFYISGPTTTVRQWHRSGGGTDMHFDDTTTPYLTVTGQMAWDNAGTLTLVSNGHYIVQWYYAIADISIPIYVVCSQAEYGNLTAARAATLPIVPMGTLREGKLIYSVVYHHQGGSEHYQEAVDYRTVNSMPNAAIDSLPAANVTFAPHDGITATDVQTAFTQVAPLTSSIVDSGTAVALTFDTTNALTTGGAKLLSLKNATVEKFYIDKDGNAYAAGTLLVGATGMSPATNLALGGVWLTVADQTPAAPVVPNRSANGAMTVTGNYADGASAVGVIVDNAITLANAGAKLLSIRNNTVEKAFIDKDGTFTLVGNAFFESGITISGFDGLWLKQASRSATNYSVLANANSLYLNAANASAGEINFLFGGGVKGSISKDGFASFVSYDAPSATAYLRGSMADGASAVGVVIDSTVTLANAAAKLLSIRNNAAEKAYVDYKGALHILATSTDVLSNVSLHLRAAIPILSLEGTVGTGRTFAITNNYTGANLMQFTYSTSVGAAATNVAMTINDSGNVGIGTTGPSTQLEVASNSNTVSRISTTNNVAYSYLSLKNDGASGSEYHVSVGGDGVGGGLANTFYIYDATRAKNRLLINSSGYVGIGTTTPVATLALNTTNAAVSILEGRLNDSSIMALNVNADNSFTLWDNGTGWKAGLSQFGGNVGIGTTQPGARLHIISSDNTDTTSIGKFAANNETLATGIGYSGIMQVGSATNGDMSVVAKGTGYVWLGVGTPGTGIRFRQTDANTIWNGTSTLGLAAGVADGAGAVGVVINNTTTLSTAGAKLLSICNNSVETFRFEANGDAYIPGYLVWDPTPARLYTRVPDSAGVTAFKMISQTALADANARLLTLENGNGSVRLAVDKDGSLSSNGYLQAQNGYFYSAGTAQINLINYVANGGSAIGTIINTGNTLSTAGAKLLSLTNNGAEKASFDKDGLLLWPDGQNIGPPVGSNVGRLQVFTSRATIDVSGDFVIDTVNDRAASSGILSVRNQGATGLFDVRGDGYIESLYGFRSTSGSSSYSFIANNQDGGGAVVAIILDNLNTLTNAGSKLLSVRNATVEKFYVDKDGEAYANGVHLGAGGGGITAPYTLAGVGDTIPFTINAAAAQTAKLQSWQVNTVEKSYINKDGGAWFGGFVGIATTAVTPSFQLEVVDEALVTNRGIAISQHNEGVHGAGFNFRKSRGSRAFQAAVASGDYGGFVANYLMDSASTYRITGGFGFKVNGTVASNSVPTDMFFYTSAANTGDPYNDGTVRMILGSTGLFAVNTTTLTTAGINIVSKMADGASAIGTLLNTGVAYTTTAKLLSVQNNSVEKAYIDSAGNLWAPTANIGLTTTPVGYAATGTLLVPTNITGATVLQGWFDNASASGRTQVNVSNSGTGAWEANFFALMVHGTSVATTLYGGTSDSGKAIVLAQGTAITRLLIGTFGAAPLEFMVGNVVRNTVASAGSNTYKDASVDGASAVAHILDTTNAYSTTGAKLLSVRNATVEKFYVDKDGNINANVYNSSKAKSDTTLDGEYMGTNGYWGFRTGTNNYFNLDLYNAGANTNVIKIQNSSLATGGGSIGFNVTPTAGFHVAVPTVSTGSATGIILGTANAFAAGDKVLSIKNAATELLYWDSDGGIHQRQGYAIYWGATSAIYGNNSQTMVLRGNMADGASAVGVALNNDTALTTAGAKLLSVQNNAVEKFYIDKDGNAYAAGVLLGSGAAPTVTDDTTTNSDYYLVFNAATSGAIAPLVSSTKLFYHPSTGALGLGVSPTGGRLHMSGDVHTLVEIDGTTSARVRLAATTATSGKRNFEFQSGGGKFLIASLNDAWGLYTNQHIMACDPDGSIAFNNAGVTTSAGYTFKSPMADGASAIGTLFNTAVAYANAGAKLLSVQNNTVEKMYVDYGGSVYSSGHLVSGATGNVYSGTGYFAANSAVGATVRGSVADGAAAVGVILNNTVTLATTGAKLLSIRNNGVEKFYVDKDGIVGSGVASAVGGGYLAYIGTDTSSGVFQINSNSTVLGNAIAIGMRVPGIAASGGTDIIFSSWTSGGGWFERARITESGTFTLAGGIMNTTSTALSLTGAVANGGGAVGVVIANSVALTVAGAKIASFKNNTVEKASIDKDGNLSIVSGIFLESEVTIVGWAGLWAKQASRTTTNYLLLTEGTGAILNAADGSTGVITFGFAGVGKSNIDKDGNLGALSFKPFTATSSIVRGAYADGASAVGVVLDNSVTLSNATAKLLSIRNNTSEKAYYDVDGRLYHGITWDDMQGPANAALIGASAPTNEQYRDTLARLMFFRHDQDDSLTFTYQTSHRWIRDTEVQVHIHYIPMVTPGADQVVRIQYSYVWAHPNTAVPANASWTTSFTDITIPTSGADTHNEKLAGLFNTTPSGSKESSILIVNITRLSSSTSDTYTTSKADNTAAANFCVLSVDAHYQSNKEGTTTAIPA